LRIGGQAAIQTYQMDGAGGVPSKSLPFLAVIPIGLLPAITIANENSNVGHHGMG